MANVDGGKLSKRSQKALAAVINTKYVFSNMNILLYADNFILPCATQEEAEGLMNESNRSKVYDLYSLAHNLEPERKPELTF